MNQNRVFPLTTNIVVKAEADFYTTLVPYGKMSGAG